MEQKRYIDVFNGDADGIIALIQLRLAQPQASTLVTGVKRDIQLLKQVKAQVNDHITVLDISLDKNRDAVQGALNAGAQVFYCDHHFAGELPEHGHFTALINTASDVCTSLLINQYLQGKYPAWAVTAAYGDNLTQSAERLADKIGLNAQQKNALEQLGIAINYNGYGAKEEDLHIHPANLFQLLLPYSDPLELIAAKPDIYLQLIENYQADMQQAESAQVIAQSDVGKIVCLPNQAWARRVSGVYGNDLANQSPEQAHAVLTVLPQGGYLVSVRSPKTRPEGADTLCMKFETGGGRKAAAGINCLPETELERFIAEFNQQYRI